MKSEHSTATGTTTMDEKDLTPSQLDVVSKLLPRVQYLQHKGLTERQIIDTLSVGEGWPVGAVIATFDRIKRRTRPR